MGTSGHLGCGKGISWYLLAYCCFELRMKGSIQSYKRMVPSAYSLQIFKISITLTIVKQLHLISYYIS